MSNLVLAIFAWSLILALLIWFVVGAGESRSRDE